MQSPSQEEARRACDTLLSFIQHLPAGASGLVDHNEYLTVVRLTERLRLQSQYNLQQQAKVAAAAAAGPGSAGASPGGLDHVGRSGPVGLGLSVSPQQQPLPPLPSVMGGLSRIPEGDYEMPNAPPAVTMA